jgi:hypothetical protein
LPPRRCPTHSAASRPTPTHADPTLRYARHHIAQIARTTRAPQALQRTKIVMPWNDVYHGQSATEARPRHCRYLTNTPTPQMPLQRDRRCGTGTTVRQPNFIE